ncbi:uncharacterized protein TNCV_2045321 [Trichonephila clavipes]|uniref:Uncharacterized protein n=1 Tax=Trichonephila clavipes TaxID=2585209 RepID=A0A8X6T409_TRICX|nr:uncharacterized protein TNCV_2045321 [Trichonephila clavipes]
MLTSKETTPNEFKNKSDISIKEYQVLKCIADPRSQFYGHAVIEPAIYTEAREKRDLRSLKSCHFWEKEKKADLLKLAIELGECKSNGEEQKIIELRTKILTNDAYKEDPEFVKCIFERIVSNRIDEENKRKSKHCVNLSCRKYDLQNETQRVVGPQTLPQTKIELKKMLPTFNPEVDNMDLLSTSTTSNDKRQLKLLDLGEDLWVPYLIGALPSDVTSLIAHEPEEKCRDYSHIQGMLLQWFKLTAEKFRELFSRHKKSPNGTWKDYYFEIRAYFEGWLNELKIPLTD